jgi:hypothetical protein
VLRPKHHAEAALADLRVEAIALADHRPGAELERRAGRRRLKTSAEPRLDTGAEYRVVDRLGDVVVRAEVECEHDICAVAARGGHDHRDRSVPRIGAHRLEHFEPGDPGHHDVEYDEVDPLRGERGEGGEPTVGGHDLEAVLGQPAREQIAILLDVIDDEEPEFALPGCSGHPPADEDITRLRAARNANTYRS